MRYSRLNISEESRSKYFNTLAEAGKNPAYTHPDTPGIVYMQYRENGEDFFTVLDKMDYDVIKEFEWEGFNEYVVKKSNHKEYLHRILSRNLKKGQIVHHKGHRFDNRSSMLEPVDRKEHDQHRTYYGDLNI